MNLVKEKFKKSVFLFRDQEATRTTLDDRNKAANLMAIALIEVSNLLDRPLTKQEKEKILNDKWEGVVDLLRMKTGFPNGEESALIGLLGLNPSNCKKAVESINRPYYPDQYTITDKDVHVSREYIKQIEDTNTFYTKNQKQNKALLIAIELADVLNKARNEGLISKLDFPVNVNVNDAYNYVKSLNALIEIKGGKIVPNAKEIWRIKEE